MDLRTPRPTAPLSLALIITMLCGIVFAAAPTAEAAPTCGGRAITVNLALGQQPDNGPNVILGTNASETINGKGGNDIICGLGGNDKIYGGSSGNDIIYGGTGADQIWGRNGNDTIYGEGGADKLFGEDGHDVLHGGNGPDILWGGSGNDQLNGDGSTDKLYGEAGADNLNGGYGSGDFANGGGYFDTCNAETETNCEVAPSWTNGAQVKLEDFNLDDFTVSWGSTTGNATELELTVTNQNGTPDTWHNINPQTTTSFEVGYFNGGALEPTDQYWISIVAKNPIGTSQPITFGPVGVVDFIETDEASYYASMGPARAFGLSAGFGRGSASFGSARSLISAAAFVGEEGCRQYSADQWKFLGQTTAVPGGATGYVCRSFANGTVTTAAFAQVGAASFLVEPSYDIVQDNGIADVTVNISEDSGWKRQSIYFNPPNGYSGCLDSQTSIFVDFKYMTYNGVLTVQDMKISNGGSRTDPIIANGFNSALYGDNLSTSTEWIDPAGSSYVFTAPAQTDSRAVWTTDPNGPPHTNGGGSYIAFAVSSEHGGGLCGPSVVLRLK